jgi:hypothetical protein
MHLLKNTDTVVVYAELNEDKTRNNECRGTCKGVYVAWFDVTDIYLEGVWEIANSLKIAGLWA